jgi:hypothetical protein
VYGLGVWNSGHITWVGMLAACGRMNFGETPPEIPDAPDTPDTLRCGEPVRFQIGASNVTALDVVPTASGFTLFTVDPSNTLHGWSYDAIDGEVTAIAENVALDVDISQTFGAAAIGDQIMVASIYGVPTALGTKVHSLDGELAPLGQPAIRAGEIAATRPISRSGLDDGGAFVDVDPATQDIRARPIDLMGRDAGPVRTVVPGAEGPNAVGIVPAAPGYAVVYSAAATSPNLARLALFDAQLGNIVGPVDISNSSFDAARPQVAWAPDSGTYLVTWYEKTPTDDDDVWMQLRGPNLEPMTPPQVIANMSHSPQVTSNGDGFWMTWISYGPERLQAAFVAPDGTVTPRAVLGSGGMPTEWSVVEREGQAVLVWTESAGSGPDLYLDPMCR